MILSRCLILFNIKAIDFAIEVDKQEIWDELIESSIQSSRIYKL